MDVNIIVTCHNREAYVPYLLAIINGYSKIKCQTIVCYNGDDPDFPCDFRTPNRDGHAGDAELTKIGYDILSYKNDCPLFLKICADCWLVDESKIVSIFSAMESNRCGYGGNRWHFGDVKDISRSSDIFFADTRFGNQFNWGRRKDRFLDGWQMGFEILLYRVQYDEGIKMFEIQERHPVNPGFRFECAPLMWTMQHELSKNIANLEKWTTVIKARAANPQSASFAFKYRTLKGGVSTHKF